MGDARSSFIFVGSTSVEHLRSPNVPMALSKLRITHEADDA